MQRKQFAFVFECMQNHPHREQFQVPEEPIYLIALFISLSFGFYHASFSICSCSVQKEAARHSFQQTFFFTLVRRLFALRIRVVWQLKYHFTDACLY